MRRLVRLLTGRERRGARFFFLRVRYGRYRLLRRRGFHFVMDRASDMIALGGENIYCSEIYTPSRGAWGGGEVRSNSFRGGPQHGDTDLYRYSWPARRT